jgi:hypothetical protein
MESRVRRMKEEKEVGWENVMKKGNMEEKRRYKRDRRRRRWKLCFHLTFIPILFRKQTFV